MKIVEELESERLNLRERVASASEAYWNGDSTFEDLIMASAELSCNSLEKKVANQFEMCKGS
jgi:hypothetical protein